MYCMEHNLNDAIWLHQSGHVDSLNSIVISGRQATLVVDPGWSKEDIARIRARATDTDAGKATHVALTHADEDHIVAWNEFGPVTLIAHPAAAARDPEKQKEWVEGLDRQTGIIRDSVYHYPAVDRFTSPQSLDLGGRTVIFQQTAGHSAEDLLMFIPEERTVVAGDYLFDWIFPLVYHSWRGYRATLDRLRGLCSEHDIQRLIPAHGGIAASPDEIARRIVADCSYLDGVRKAVAAAYRSGASLDEAKACLADIQYLGRSIAPNWVSVHQRHAKFLYEHPEELAD